MKHKKPHILLVNPWIHDFAAYDVWAKPVGLLYLASILRNHGFGVSYIDCLDRFHPKADTAAPETRHGRGPYLKTKIPPPKGLEDIPRTYSRYGILKDWFLQDISEIPSPDLIFVTSLMTYWYPGVFETIALIKDKFPNTPVVLGGIYASLCREHAKKYSGAHKVVTGGGEALATRLVSDYTGCSVQLKFDPANYDTYPYPAFDLQQKIGYIALVTSRGCPFSCTYCASNFLNPKLLKRSPENVVQEIRYWHEKYGVKDFAFYDDALLIDAKGHAVPIFNKIVKADLDLCFHTPNALHIREISKDVAGLMFKSGFTTIRLGLETASFNQRDEMDQKVTGDDFKRAVSHLMAAGFESGQIGAYLLVGLPGQSLASIEDSIKTVKQTGIKPVLAHYTPIPHTAMWEKAVASSRYNLEADPVFTNNAVFPCWKENFSWERISYLKKLC